MHIQPNFPKLTSKTPSSALLIPSVPSCPKHRAKANQRQRCNTAASAPHSFVQLVGGTENSPETHWERPFCQASSPREAWHEIALWELETPQLWLILDYDGLSWINCDGLWWMVYNGSYIYIYISAFVTAKTYSCCHGSKSDQRPDICPLPLWAMPSSHSMPGRRDPAMPAVKISWDDELLGASASTWESEAIPSGEHTKSYWKWPFIADFPIKNGDFPLLC